MLLDNLRQQQLMQQQQQQQQQLQMNASAPQQVWRIKTHTSNKTIGHRSRCPPPPLL
jgi:hypothetical protein